MNKTFLFALLFSVSLLMQAQDKIETDFEEIEQIIADTSSDKYYPVLLDRFNNFDSTLTIQDYALLYYGFSFQENYLSALSEDGDLNQMIKIGDLAKIEAECKRILEIYPFSLKVHDELLYSLSEQDKSVEEYTKYMIRYRALRKVIALSGDGLTVETAFKVISVPDEYNIIRTYFEISEIYSQSLVAGGTDYFKIDKSEYYKSSEIYFDISRNLIRQAELYKKD